ncbi:DNA cytosine methyltransferase [Mucilaginibacter rubeus]|uniref:DNA (cytosine-5-)-methyltransferase n=1 Tax=Mucilaginibacter rubeus TaxID=2027860 RepID=A0A5C1I8F6_9SPHI|nr:DNA cytosine methyltransferase [Mucilaginibacter rubeus]
MQPLTLIDLFCGAGGFSEGFAQQGFKVLLGIDNWRPAIDSFNHNHGTNSRVMDVLELKDDIAKINALPDSDVILGSPPCVSFSSSNRSGKADKSLGLTLIETFLRVVAVKKHQPNSCLKAWFMENVSRSAHHLPEFYTFEKLGLSDWASTHDIDPAAIAVQIAGNMVIINSADMGSPQSRKRAVCGEIVHIGHFVVPNKTHRSIKEDELLPLHRTLDDIRSVLPRPDMERSEVAVRDPNYSHVRIPQSQLTDHFYDTGLYRTEWLNSRHLKVNHPFMGTMSFPEDGSRPSRTITATKIGTSREALIYRSERDRVGDGEYRTPTVREAASIMGFPISYQFLGSEGAKWRLVGNAVCPALGRALAATLLNGLQRPINEQPEIRPLGILTGVLNLNTYIEKIFDEQPTRNKGSRFRRHPFKNGNLTITLSNYDITTSGASNGQWLSSVQYGNGDGFPSVEYPDGFFDSMEPMIKKLPNGEEFLQIINNGFSERIATASALQSMYEAQRSFDGYLEPTELIEEVARLAERFDPDQELVGQGDQVIFRKLLIPKRQILALYAVNKIASIANKR